MQNETNELNGKEQETKLSFEQALKELEAIVKRMETGEQSLELSLEEFEKGIKIVRECRNFLEEAEQRVEILTRPGRIGKSQIIRFRIVLLMIFDQDWKRCQQAVEAALEAWLPSADEPPQKLHQAMRYSTLNGGKRFRAVLVIMTGEMLGVDTKLLMAPAAAVECMHAYSLVHDDLPCMDDDDFRRGVPSCHIAYGESAAVLWEMRYRHWHLKYSRMTRIW